MISRSDGRACGHSGARSRRGFTLFTMLVALVLLGVGVGALANATSETLKSQTSAQNKTNAIAIARAYLESVRTRDPWQITSEGGTRVDADGASSSAGAYTKAMDAVVERSNLLRLTVTVAYPRMMSPVVLTTYLFRGRAAGSAGP